MPTFRVHFKSKGGDQYMLLDAPNREKAEQDATRAQYRRQERFPLTFDRLAQSLETGEKHPLLAAEKGKSTEFSKGLYKVEVEKRKRDQARYEDDDLKIVSVEAV